MSTEVAPVVIREIEIMHPMVVQILRQKTPAERLALASGLRKSATKMLQSFLKGEHPTWTDEQIQAEIARRIPLGNR
jgi:Rv0078B-related antitoxin